MDRKCSFKHTWLKEPQFEQWLNPAEGKNTAAIAEHAVKDYKRIDLSNMGRRALTSHAQSLRHKDKMKLISREKESQPKLHEKKIGSNRSV